MRHSLVRLFIPFAAVALPAIGCGERPESTSDPDEDWTLESDTRSKRSPDTGIDGAAPVERETEMPDCAPNARYNPVTGECERMSTDTGTQPDAPRLDTEIADTGTPADTGGPPEPVYPQVGQTFQGPTVTGRGDAIVEADYGVGLYWQSALSQFGDQTLHRLLSDRSIMDLSRITTKSQRPTFRFRLPDRPDETYHFYRKYCDKVGDSECRQQGIDDDTPAFTLFMLALHQAPANGEASDCTWGQIYGKTRCHYGHAVAPSDTMILYAYEDFTAEDYPVFDFTCVSDTESFEPGYYAIRQRSCGDSQTVVPFSKKSGEVEVDLVIDVTDDAMFPMLYP